MKSSYYLCKCGHEEQVCDNVTIELHVCKMCKERNCWEKLPFQVENA